MMITVLGVGMPLDAGDGFREFLGLMCGVLIFGILSLVISLWFKMSGKDRANIFFINILTKTIANFLTAHLAWRNIYLYIGTFVTIVIFEGILYLNLLSYKKINPFVISLITNVPIGILIVLLAIPTVPYIS